MSFFLGLFPDEYASKEIDRVLREVKMTFEGFEIPVRWAKQGSYHITLTHLGEKFPFYKRFYLKFKFRKFKFRRFKIKFNTVKLGISRRYKELIYMDLALGGDDMRKLLLQFKQSFKMQSEGNFIPHLTLGRVSKELTDQEYANICRDLTVITKNLDIRKIEFYVNDLRLIKSTDEGYQVLMNFTSSSRI